ncbi:zinc-binding dehydrogenase [Curtobacterium flaccumfaciens pv. oortii]|uniref:zinc-binding dehydrogenase n=1 Tax=Curtobacterium flaccumfaciens TaxID=2035 RepID=UPI001BDF64AB|nr:zinc-binding dehydrogenase [Curtobacterium flaccumfaciens]MBT1621912.1 zinc-binding dehydrogenase [Curtobacterium flaccumfaciens pv. oortii]
MLAVTIQSFGSPDGLVPTDLTEPVAAPGQVVIDVEAIGVGGVDAVIRRGTLGRPGIDPGYVPGSEVAGRVVAVGNALDDAWLGRRVWAFTGVGGAYAERVVARIADLTPLDDGFGAVEAVALGSAAPVARFALAHAHLDAGERVLVRGAAGSIGIAAVELAVQAGAEAVAVTTGSAERGERLRGLGATHVLDRQGLGDGPEAYDAVIDIVGGPAMPDFIDRLAPNGRLVIVGAVAGMPPADFGGHLLRAFQQSRSVATFSLDSVPRGALAAARAELFRAAAAGELTPVVDDVLPLAEAAEAHRRMDAGRVFGRIVLTP